MFVSMKPGTILFAHVVSINQSHTLLHDAFVFERKQFAFYK